MAKELVCALTHVRHEHVFLDKWIAHYAPIVGRENLYVVLDGDDWEPSSDLTGIHVEVVTDAPRRRLRNDRWAAKAMSARAHQLRKSYDFVIRGDVDEYVVVDPDCGMDWETALREDQEQGYSFALGVDVVQNISETEPVDPERPILSQRRFGYVADRYTKPFVISRWNNWAGGAHRLINRPVVMNNRFVLFHLALCDADWAAARMQARGGAAQHVSFVDHQTYRLEAISRADGLKPVDFAQAYHIAFRDFPVEPDGSVAKRPRQTPDPLGSEEGIFTTIPDRFADLC